jgi:hypothetical protein
MTFVGIDKSLNRARQPKNRACSSCFDGSIKTGQALDDGRLQIKRGLGGKFVITGLGTFREAQPLAHGTSIGRLSHMTYSKPIAVLAALAIACSGAAGCTKKTDTNTTTSSDTTTTATAPADTNAATAGAGNAAATNMATTNSTTTTTTTNAP